MIFILVMVVLHYMLRYAGSHGIISPIGFWGLAHRLSIFAEDVMLFLKDIKKVEVCTDH